MPTGSRSGPPSGFRRRKPDMGPQGTCERHLGRLEPFARPPGKWREGQRHRHRTQTDAQGADIQPTIVVESVEYHAAGPGSKGHAQTGHHRRGAEHRSHDAGPKILARENFGPRIMGTVFGAATMVSSLGMAFGPWAGGMIFDTFNDYRWLYIGSLSVGLGAMAVALAFPPLPRRSRERLQPA